MASANAKFAIRLLLRAQLRKKGYGINDINFMLAATSDGSPDLIDEAVAQSGVADELAAAETAAAAAADKDAPGTGAAGTGVFAQIVAALMTFLESPQGQAIIGSLITMLIAALGHAFCLCGIVVRALLTSPVIPIGQQLRRPREHRHQAR